MNLADSHCHLADPKLRGDLEGIVARAHAAGVRTIVSVGAIGPIENDRITVELAEKYEGIFAAIGVHPHDAQDCDDRRLNLLRDLARSNKVVAIGETGLDFHYMRSGRELQEASLRRHLELAAELNKPVVIHCRDGERRIQEIVRDVASIPANGVIHCFTGDIGAAREFVALGFYISFSGILTFRNADSIRAAVSAVPDDRLMVETDAPYLAPEPYRGKRNEPAYAVRTLEVLAKLRGVDPERMASQVTANASRLFSLP